MKSIPRRGKAAFTLIELMAVITIIVILAALVVGGLGFVQERQAKEKAKVQMALLSKALDDYKLDMGYYPRTGNSTDPTGNTALLYNALFYEGFQYAQNPSSATATKASKIYLADLDPTTTKQGWVVTSTGNTPAASLKITDPWGNEYRYRSSQNLAGKDNGNANTQNPDYDLWSVGKDGVTNGGPSAANIKDTKNRDDIRNF
jgi:general secretion pathway protein G